MYNDEEIMQFVYLIVEVANPDRIILFGSYAYGVPDDKSDLDLLVIKKVENISIDDETKMAVAIYEARKQRQIKTKYDVFFSTDKQANNITEKSSAFMEALQKGKIVYERIHQ
ncbi:MAG: nucleotidyltransferase domain-containing protein [Oscillospiraceae bacterium]|jgi:predicted nucleotidyltransferase|nr:nucleotidyltransferase domain-containing protein [Oscillospiraceae bacterium]